MKALHDRSLSFQISRFLKTNKNSSLNKEISLNLLEPVNSELNYLSKMFPCKRIFSYLKLFSIHVTKISFTGFHLTSRIFAASIWKMCDLSFPMRYWMHSKEFCQKIVWMGTLEYLFNFIVSHLKNCKRKKPFKLSSQLN